MVFEYTFNGSPFWSSYEHTAVFDIIVPALVKADDISMKDIISKIIINK